MVFVNQSLRERLESFLVCYKFCNPDFLALLGDPLWYNKNELMNPRMCPPRKKINIDQELEQC
jgi:hypothetical protein